jgi:hypothetical protein
VRQVFQARLPLLFVPFHTLASMLPFPMNIISRSVYYAEAIHAVTRAKNRFTHVVHSPRTQRGTSNPTMRVHEHCLSCQVRARARMGKLRPSMQQSSVGCIRSVPAPRSGVDVIPARALAGAPPTTESGVLARRTAGRCRRLV